MGISKYVIIIVSLAILLIPISQADAIFFIPSEINEKQLTKDFKEMNNLKLQKFRDWYIEEYLGLQNPYTDKISKNEIVFGEEFTMPKKISRYDENFQSQIDKELDIAQKKYLEIMGGKSITSSLDDKSDKRIIPVLEFTEEERSFLNVIHRNDEDFQIYKMQQKIIAEETFNRLMKEGFWGEFRYAEDMSLEDFNKNRDYVKDTYFENESFNVKELIGNDTVSLNRLSEEFKDVMKAEILLAENIRNDVLKKSTYGNPYEVNEDIIEINQEEIFEPNTKSVNRVNDEFLLDMEKQKEIALEIMNKIYNIKNLDKNEIEMNLQDKEVKKQSYYARHDQGFKFFKQLEENKAGKKLNEILGGKIISNHIDMKHREGKNSLIEHDFISNGYEEFQNYESVLLAIVDKIRENDYDEKSLIPSSYTIEEKIEVENKPVRDPNVLCFGLGC